MFCAFRTGVLGSGKSFSQQLFTRDKRLGTSISVPMLMVLWHCNWARPKFLNSSISSISFAFENAGV
jgi:hypothetical protein